MGPTLAFILAVTGLYEDPLLAGEMGEIVMSWIAGFATLVGQRIAHETWGRKPKRRTRQRLK